MIIYFEKMSHTEVVERCSQTTKELKKRDSKNKKYGMIVYN